MFSEKETETLTKIQSLELLKPLVIVSFSFRRPSYLEDSYAIHEMLNKWLTDHVYYFLVSLTCKCTSAVLSHNSLMRHFAVNLPAGVTVTKTRHIQQSVTFCHHWLHLWLMNISYLDLRSEEDNKHTYTRAHRNRAAADTVLHVLSQINISFALLLCLDADWHPFLRGQLRDVSTHTILSTQHTHTLNNSEPLFALTDVSAMLCWHLVDTLSLSDAHHCLPTTLSKMPHVSMCICLCKLVSSTLPVCHHYTLKLFHFLDHCLHI